jgi:hypothetical protein
MRKTLCQSDLLLNAPHSTHSSSLSLGCPLGWPAGVSSILSMGEQPSSVLRSRGPHKVMPMCSRLLGRLPSDETPGVSPLGRALVAGRACLLVLYCCAHPTEFLTILAISSLSYCRTQCQTHEFHTFLFIGRLISLMWLE